MTIFHELVSSLARPNDTTAYAAGDVISDVTSNDHYSWAAFSRENGWACTLKRAVITVSAAVATEPDLELWLFDTDIVEVADNLAFAVTDAEILTCIGIVKFPTADFIVGSGNVICETDKNLNMQLKGLNSATLYGQLVVRNSYASTASEVYSCRLFTEEG